MLDALEDWVLTPLIVLVIIALGIGAVVSAVQEITEPDAGTVTSKEYQPSSTTTSGGMPIHSTQCTTSGYPPTTSCQTVTTGYTATTTTHHPECWQIEFKDGAGAEGDDCVSSELYRKLKVGDHYAK